jgi:hypothetical protein
MKVAVECQSPLLQKSLELFLVKYLTSVKQSDIIIRDVECMNDKRCFYISGKSGADLVKPFSKSQLIIELEKRYETLYIADKEVPVTKKITLHEEVDFSILENRIDFLTKEYQANILRAVKAFYEK